jgi:hypothetical protein
MRGFTKVIITVALAALKVGLKLPHGDVERAWSLAGMRGLELAVRTMDPHRSG